MIKDALLLSSFEIPVIWWKHDFKKMDLSDNEWYINPEVIKVKERNFNGIDESDAVVLVCPEDNSKKYNGANIEVGYALGKEKPVYSIGCLERSAMYCDVIKCIGIKHLISELQKG